jgi:TetR/AcrR family transcriptional regulator, transcriptional repressor for nem operon
LLTNQSKKAYIQSMPRKKSYDTNTVMEQMAKVFLVNGYNATSLDDLVTATGLLRGSLYSGFGSKRGMFVSVLKHQINQYPDDSETLMIIIIVLLELTPNDIKIRQYLSD